MTTTQDVVGATGVTTYTYDAANRLTSVGGVAYTWDDRGNLVSDGTFTYTYDAAGRMVQAESVTSTLVYTYNASGLRVAQSVDGDATTFAWDWASGIPKMLSNGEDLYLVGHETLGQWDGAVWAFYLPDALGSIRQETDGTGNVTDSREWTPFGVEVGTAQEGLGYTGEWLSGYVDLNLLYLRARWLDVGTGRFITEDTAPGYARVPRSLHVYVYAWNDPINLTDPTGLQPPVDCEPGDICHTGALGSYPPSSPPASAVVAASDMWRTCEQYRATLALRARSGRPTPPSQSELILAALCSSCYENPQPNPEIDVDPLGQEIAGPILVDSGIRSFFAWIVNVQKPGEGRSGGMPTATSVQFFSRMKAWVAFYERGTRLDISDWYDTENFRLAAHLAGDWSDDYSMHRSVSVITTIGGRDGPFSLGEVQGARQGEGALEYRLRYLYPEQANELVMLLAIHFGDEGIPVGNVRKYSTQVPSIYGPFDQSGSY
jgi:RHS repeat-associated protein